MHSKGGDFSGYGATHRSGIVPLLDLEGIELMASDYHDSFLNPGDNLLDSCGSEGGGFEG